MFTLKKSLSYAFGAGLLVATAVASTSAMADTLNGAGGTAIYPVLSDWAVAYQKISGTSVNYQAIGSGGGIKQIESKTVPFANSDKPLTPDTLAQQGLVQFPGVIIGITPVVNLPHIKAGELVLDGKTLADIYLGKVTEWDSREIKALNPHVRLPHMKITTVHRADGSGTTFNFTNYLAKVSPEWKNEVGSDTAVSWPGNGVGGKGNAGVAKYVQDAKGALGYVEYAYCLQNHMTYVLLRNKAGHYVAPTSKNFQAAAAHADWAHSKGFYMVLTDQPGKDSWPITGATYVLIHKNPTDAKALKTVLEFFNWAYRHGAPTAEKLDYVPMPLSVAKMVEHSWAKEIRANGQQLWK